MKNKPLEEWKEIKLTNGYVTKVDGDDYEKFSVFKWSATRGIKKNKTNYVRAERGEKGKKLSLSREIMNAPKGMYVDHINGDTLDNRKANLRLSTNSQNSMNRKIGIRNTSGYKGVSWLKSYGKWSAQICRDYKTHVIGYFDIKEDAALAYNEAAKKLFGEFAVLNIIKPIGKNYKSSIGKKDK